MGCSSCGGNGRVGIPSSAKVVSSTGRFVVKYPNGVIRAFAAEAAADAAVSKYGAEIISAAADNSVDAAPADEAPVGISTTDATDTDDVDDYDYDTDIDSDDVLESTADEGA